LKQNPIRQIEAIVRHYLHIDPETLDLCELLERYVEAEWIEKRLANMIATSINRGVMGDEG